MLVFYFFYMFNFCYLFSPNGKDYFDELLEIIKEIRTSESGFDTDACVQKTALDLFENAYDVYVLKDYCMNSSSEELHNMIITNFKRLIVKNKII